MSRDFKPSTDAELDELANISSADIERAKSAWKKDADPQYRDLLDAEPDEDRPTQ